MHFYEKKCAKKDFFKAIFAHEKTLKKCGFLNKKCYFCNKNIHNMHRRIVEKIKSLREKKGIDIKTMADKLHVDLTTYKRLEKGTTLTWSKYLEDILDALDISQEEFFSDIVSTISIKNNNGSFGSYNLSIENLFAENKEKSQKIHELFEERIKDSEKRLEDKDKIITELKEILEIKKHILTILDKVENK
jgi:transcriptional regulator with XRE-family HTH domain